MKVERSEDVRETEKCTNQDNKDKKSCVRSMTSATSMSKNTSALTTCVCVHLLVYCVLVRMNACTHLDKRVVLGIILRRAQVTGGEGLAYERAYQSVHVCMCVLGRV